MLDGEGRLAENRILWDIRVSATHNDRCKKGKCVARKLPLSCGTILSCTLLFGFLDVCPVRYSLHDGMGSLERHGSVSNAI